MAARALPPSWPGYQVSRMAFTRSCQADRSNSPPELATTTTLSLYRAIRRMKSSCPLGKVYLRSIFSASESESYPTQTITAAALRRTSGEGESMACTFQFFPRACSPAAGVIPLPSSGCTHPEPPPQAIIWALGPVTTIKFFLPGLSGRMPSSFLRSTGPSSATS